MNLSIREETEPIPCQSVTTCQEPSAYVIENSAGTEFHLCERCAGSYLEAGDE